MEQAVLTKDQELALALVGNDAVVKDLFYLSGGTALAAFYLHHRYSDDLDFFTDAGDFPQIAIELIAEKIRAAIGAEKTEYQRLYDRRIFFFKKSSEELKVEFTSYPFAALHPRMRQGGVLVDSLEDLAANKMMALIDRVEPKDFTDLYFLLHENHITIDHIRSLVEQKFYFSINPVTLGAEFAKVRLVTNLPRMIKPLTIAQLKNFFTEHAKQLQPDILA